MRQASAASKAIETEAIETEAIETEVSLKVWDVLHPRAVGEGGGEQSELTAGVLAVVAEGSGLRVIHIIFQERKKKKPKKKKGCAS